MPFPNIRRYSLLAFITIIPTVLLASLFLFLGVVNLISPDVNPSALGENARVCAMLILTAATLIYALFRPYSGGFFLCICAVLFSAIFHFHPFFVTISGLVLLIGLLSVIRGRLSRRTASEDCPPEKLHPSINGM